VLLLHANVYRKEFSEVPDCPQPEKKTCKNEQVCDGYDPQHSRPPQKRKSPGYQKTKQATGHNKQPNPGESPPIIASYCAPSASGREQINFESQIAESQN
jgi:hypothetical protein